MTSRWWIEGVEQDIGKHESPPCSTNVCWEVRWMYLTQHNQHYSIVFIQLLNFLFLLSSFRGCLSVLFSSSNQTGECYCSFTDVSQIYINYCWCLNIWPFKKSIYHRIVILGQVTLIIMFLHIIIINNLLYKLLCCFCRKINILLFILLRIHHEC
jgi:fucose 4-O-acetylase-like acetyltransferase